MIKTDNNYNTDNKIVYLNLRNLNCNQIILVYKLVNKKTILIMKMNRLIIMTLIIMRSNNMIIIFSLEIIHNIIPNLIKDYNQIMEINLKVYGIFFMSQFIIWNLNNFKLNITIW